MNRVTKMELLRLKRQESILVKSVSLLKDKRDSLINKIVDSLNLSKRQYDPFSKSQDELVSVFRDLFLKYDVNLLNLESINQPSYFNIDSEVISFLNLSWLLLKPSLDLSFFDSNYFIIKSGDLSRLKSAMSDFVNQLCVFGSTLSNVSVFLREVRALNRRVNFLEKTRLPVIRKLINQLMVLLDEREREDIIRLKKVKELIINE